MPTPAERFLSLHVPGQPLVMPNPWDVGSARLFASMGCAALATTSSGFAATLGRRDYGLTRDEAVDHLATIVAATDVPVSGDLENGFGPTPDDAAVTVRRAAEVGAAGCSIEDSTGDQAGPIHPFELAVERVSAAAEVARSHDLVLTARAENHLHGVGDLDDTIRRLQAYEAAGAHVVFAPGVTEIDDVAAIVDAVGIPVSVLGRRGAPTVPELAAVGVARVSVGGGLAMAALAAAATGIRELLEQGTYGYWDAMLPELRTIHDALT